MQPVTRASGCDAAQPGNDRDADEVVILVTLARSTTSFHRLLALLHRKRIGFSSVVFDQDRMLLRFDDARSLERITSIIETESHVVRTEARRVGRAPLTEIIVERFRASAD